MEPSSPIAETTPSSPMDASPADITRHMAVEWETAMDTKVGSGSKLSWSSTHAENCESQEMEDQETPYRAADYNDGLNGLGWRGFGSIWPIFTEVTRLSYGPFPH
jgi:hypothetical protein